MTEGGHIRGSGPRASADRLRQPIRLAQYGQQQRQRRCQMVAVAVAVVAVLMVLDRWGWLLDRDGPWRGLDGKRFAVSRIIDGQTLEVVGPDGQRGTTLVRLSGVLVPPVPRGAGREETGPPVTDDCAVMIRRWCLGKTVRLVLDQNRLLEASSHLLAGVQLPDRTLLNERLLAAGLARADRRWHHGELDRFIVLEQQARHDGVGMWGRSDPELEPASFITHGQPLANPITSRTIASGLSLAATMGAAGGDQITAWRGAGPIGSGASPSGARWAPLGDLRDPQE